jgi:hypothetical protein
MRIRIERGLHLRSRAGFWKNDTAAVRAVRTIQFNNLLFYLLFILHNILRYIIFIVYYSSDSPSSLTTESLSFTQSLSSLSQHRPPIEFHLQIRPTHCLCNTSFNYPHLFWYASCLSFSYCKKA